MVRIREAAADDAAAITALIRELGYDVTERDVAARLQLLRERGEPALVADTAGVAGCLTWHKMHVLHRPRPVGRITMLVVAAEMRSRGIGAALVEAAEERLRDAGCGLIEVTSNVKRVDAHRFYARLGYEQTSFRFAKSLQD
ncbi:MAG TPA: GNAT family N-acetyltransferase [Allosphingosinicella sp.]|jgi:GNAT superfamily N-acetyltransferase